MPVYQYKGQFYDLADTDPFIAKAKIQRHLGESAIPQQTQAVVPPEPDMGAADPFMTGIASALSAEPGAVTQPRPAGYQSVLEKYNIERAGKPIPFTPEEGAALSNLANIQRTQAQVAQGREIQARQQAARQAQREAAKAEDYGITDFFKDTGIDVSKGVVGLGEAYVGLLDLTSGGAAGRVLGDLGYDPERTNKFLTGFQSLTRQEAGRSVQEAEGFINTLSALGVNPTALVGTVAESLPGTVLSGAVGGKFVRFLAGKAANEATSLGLTALLPRSLFLTGSRSSHSRLLRLLLVLKAFSPQVKLQRQPVKVAVSGVITYFRPWAQDLALLLLVRLVGRLARRWALVILKPVSPPVVPGSKVPRLLKGLPLLAFSKRLPRKVSLRRCLSLLRSRSFRTLHWVAPGMRV